LSFAIDMGNWIYKYYENYVNVGYIVTKIRKIEKFSLFLRLLTPIRLLIAVKNGLCNFEIYGRENILSLIFEKLWLLICIIINIIKSVR